MRNLEGLLSAESSVLGFHSPYSFLREPAPAEQARRLVLPKLLELAAKPECHLSVEEGGQSFSFLFQHLSWDSNYFSIPTFKLQLMAGESRDPERWARAVRSFLSHLGHLSRGRFYCFMELPSEDLYRLQLLTGNGFRLIETRLNYFNDQVQQFTHERFPVRDAVESDIPLLRKVAMEARNEFDRFHADPIFGPALADGFLATYIENSIRGFADIIVVPNAPDLPSAGFLTGVWQKENWPILGRKVSKMVLSAVGQECRGWYRKLVSELTFRFKDGGVDCVYMNTQSTNRAVVRVWESLGYRFGSSVHVLSFVRQD